MKFKDDETLEDILAAVLDEMHEHNTPDTIPNRIDYLKNFRDLLLEIQDMGVDRSHELLILADETNRLERIALKVQFCRNELRMLHTADAIEDYDWS